ncbi:MAG TPA: nucleotidyltransferase domain-containing protein [Methylocystis sp.]|nr:nucleotidyltransferase domain-containing protein [Methylocystis sp.]
MKEMSTTTLRLHRAVQEAALRLARATDAEAVLLFGSRARGEDRPDSDWDLCIILPDDVEAGRFNAVSLWPLTEADGESIQIYPIRRSIFEEKRHDVNAVSHDIYEDGIILCGAL